jgi:hypothetical protein
MIWEGCHCLGVVGVIAELIAFKKIAEDCLENGGERMMVEDCLEKNLVFAEHHKSVYPS